jgi:hypothetical protein
MSLNDEPFHLSKISMMNWKPDSSIQTSNNLVLYGLDYIIDVTVEFPSKNGANPCPYCV